MSTIPGQTLNNWTIRLKHTSLSSYTTASLDASGWTTVYQANQTISATGWVDFVFSTPFAYNGTSNLLIDFSHNNSSCHERRLRPFQRPRRHADRVCVFGQR